MPARGFVSARTMMALMRLVGAEYVFRTADAWQKLVRCSPLALKAASVVAYDRAKEAQVA